MANPPETTTPSTGFNHGSDSHRGLLLLSVPRTASHLFVRVLNIHQSPQVLTNPKAGYFFHRPYLIFARNITKPADQWTDAEKAQVREAYQESLNDLEELRRRARRANKIPFAKEHAFWIADPSAMCAQSTDGAGAPGSFFRLQLPADAGYGPRHTFSRHNRTLFPDEYLRTWRMVFIIRHPALAWPSMYRAMQKLTELQFLDEDRKFGASLANMSLVWIRELFDWSLQETKTVPLVMDAHDLIHSPATVLRFCEAAGLDTSVVQFEWGATGPMVKGNTVEDQTARIMASTLAASKGIVKDKAPATVDIKTEAEKWRAEFGEEAAGMIEKAVWDAMPDYEYLREKRVQA